MVELLSVHVVQIAVALEGVNAGDDIEVFHLRPRLEVGDGFDKGVLIEVARRDDVGLGVFGQDCRNEVLGGKERGRVSRVVDLMYGVERGEEIRNTYSRNLRLCNTVLDAAVHRGPGITVNGRGATLGAPVYVDGVEGVVSVQSLP